jgi:hypothetical protein
MDIQNPTSTVQKIEERIALLRASGRVSANVMDRAESLLVTQLSVSNGSRPVRVVIHADGSRSYTVRSGSKLSRTYTVSGDFQSCNCPAEVACYHRVSCYVLDRVLFPVQSGGVPCDGCGTRHPISDLYTVENGEFLAHLDGEALCPRCYDSAA